MSKYLFNILSILALLLTGCGSGGDGDSDTGAVSGGEGSTGIDYVAGEFKTAYDSSHYFPTDPLLSGLGAIECIYDHGDNYFESANVLIYGDPSLPDSDFKYAATMIENNFSKALGLMGLSKAEFDGYRPQYSPSVANNVIGFLDGHNGTDGTDQDITNVDSDFVVPAGWDEMDYYTRRGIIHGYWNVISNEKQSVLVALMNQYFGRDLASGNTVPDKIVVCLDNARDKELYGEGSILGMNIAPNSKASRSDAEQVILHELVHTIQMNVSTPADGNGVNDTWFMEGQAAFLAGQNMATSASGYYPVDVVHYLDSDGVFQRDLGLAYKHFAKAYSYIDEHSGKDAALNLLIDVRNYNGNGTTDVGYGVSSDRFSEAFDANVLKKDGSQLTIEDFRNNYQYIMNN
jgi:hypothetical protein